MGSLGMLPRQEWRRVGNRAKWPWGGIEDLLCVYWTQKVLGILGIQKTRDVEFQVKQKGWSWGRAEITLSKGGCCWGICVLFFGGRRLEVLDGGDLGQRIGERGKFCRTPIPG